ncbi:MAG: cytochrome c maturation protein CcmE [Deltaproteobacteria bacterium]|nr:cytochrome c maturation protein CcmE [Deltaproteobacteria bacterium]
MLNKKNKKLFLLLFFASITIALGIFLFKRIEKNIIYYWTPEELIAQGEAAYNKDIRLGGIVCNDSFDFSEDNKLLYFFVGMNSKCDSAKIKILTQNPPPQMLREGTGVVIEGRNLGKLFTAERLMVKHSSNYHPKTDEPAHIITK